MRLTYRYDVDFEFTLLIRCIILSFLGKGECRNGQENGVSLLLRLGFRVGSFGLEIEMGWIMDASAVGSEAGSWLSSYKCALCGVTGVLRARVAGPGLVRG